MKGPLKPAPPGWPRISSALYYDDAETAIDWLCNAFGFMVRLKVADDDGSIVHSELEYGDGLIMVGQTGRGDEEDSAGGKDGKGGNEPVEGSGSDNGGGRGDGKVEGEGEGGGQGDGDGTDAWRAQQASPLALNRRNTQSLCVYVDDVDAHCERARAAGAQIFREPKTTDYGEKYWADRSYGARDPEGHMWWFMQRMRTAGE